MRRIVRRTLYDFYSPYFSLEVMVKFTRKAKGHLLMLVQITMHLISGQDILKGTYTYTGFDDQKYKVPIERGYNFSQLHEGDHIAIKRLYGVYWHHAIIEDVETERGIINVIEYSNSAKEFSQDSSSPFKNPGIATVRRGKYSGLEDSLYLIKHKKYKPADTVVLRAKSRLGENKYDPLNNNCEHFALWCKTGISSSEQVGNIEKTVRKNVEETVKNAPLDWFAWVVREGGEEVVTTMVREVTKKVVTQTVSKRGQVMKASAQTVAKQVVSQTVSKGGQEILTRETTKEFFYHTAKKAGEEIVTKGIRETTREVVTQTSKTTGKSAGESLIGGAAFVAVFEVALAAYDIYCDNEELKAGNISEKEFNDAVVKRIVVGVVKVAGSTIGAVIVQLPVVGGFVGSVVGGLTGRILGGAL